MLNIKEKYFKYKEKYLKLKTQLGASGTPTINEADQTSLNKRSKQKQRRQEEKKQQEEREKAEEDIKRAEKDKKSIENDIDKNKNLLKDIQDNILKKEKELLDLKIEEKKQKQIKDVIISKGSSALLYAKKLEEGRLLELNKTYGEQQEKNKTNNEMLKLLKTNYEQNMATIILTKEENKKKKLKHDEQINAIEKKEKEISDNIKNISNDMDNYKKEEKTIGSNLKTLNNDLESLNTQIMHNEKIIKEKKEKEAQKKEEQRQIIERKEEQKIEEQKKDIKKEEQRKEEQRIEEQRKEEQRKEEQIKEEQRKEEQRKEEAKKEKKKNDKIIRKTKKLEEVAKLTEAKKLPTFFSSEDEAKKPLTSFVSPSTEKIYNDWVDENKINYNNLCSNPNAISVLEKIIQNDANDVRIDWSRLSSNPNATSILKKNMKNIKIHPLCSNTSEYAIEILTKKYMNAVTAKLPLPQLDYGRLFRNPNAIELINIIFKTEKFDEKRLKNVIKNLCVNTHEHAIKILKAKKEYIDWVMLSRNNNEEAIQMFAEYQKENNLPETHFLSGTKNGVAHLISSGKTKLINYDILGASTHIYAIYLLLIKVRRNEVLSDICWKYISKNPEAGDIIKLEIQNAEQQSRPCKIDYDLLSENPIIFK